MSISGVEPTKHEFPCESCGAKLQYAPGQEHLACPYCGHEQPIGDVGEAKPIVEYDFQAALAQLRNRPRDPAADPGEEVRCTSCGAISQVLGQADHCAFCGSPVVLQPRAQDLIAPESVLPFKVDRRAAQAEFKRWVEGLWFAPNDLRRRAETQGADGAYLPYWTYDSATQTAYTGQRGEYYWVTESYTDAQGKRQSRQVRKTRWYPAAGTVEVPFDDVLVCASRSLPAKLIDTLEPWDLDELRPYDPAYLSGFTAERYAIDLDEGFAVANTKMEPIIREHICRAIGGDTQRIFTTVVRHQGTTFKHLLLPLWISCFRYRQRVYRFVVNARTGEVSGERPWSVAKISLAVAFGVLLVVLGVLLVRHLQP